MLDVASGQRVDLAVVPGRRLVGVNEGGRILALDSDSILACNEGTTTFETVHSWVEDPHSVASDSTGQFLLVEDERDGEQVFFWVDVQTGQQRELLELAGMDRLSVGSATQDFMLCVPQATNELGVPGAAYQVLDMPTGEPSSPLVQDSTEVWTAMPAGDVVGRYALVNAISPGSGRMWLVDLAAGTASLIGASSGNVSARLSPDGCQIAVGIFDTIGEGRASEVTVTSMIEGSLISTITDSLLLGWAETVP